MAIKDWPEGERPRERLLERGAQALSDAELLAVCLRTGTAGRSAIDLGRDAIARFGGLNGLFAASAVELAQLGGLGPAKSAQLQAVIELARRALHEEVRRETVLSAPAKVRDYLRLSLASLPHEVFVVLFLDAQTGCSPAANCFAARSRRPAFIRAKSSSGHSSTTPRP